MRLGTFQFVGRCVRQFCLVLLVVAGVFGCVESASAQVIRVDVDSPGNGPGDTWSNAFDNLQDALTYAGTHSVDQIWVAEGTYTPASGPCDPEKGCDVHISFVLVNEVAMYGGFVGTETDLEDRMLALHVTILSGDILGDDGANFANRTDNSWHVIKAVDANAETIVDGFTIKGGYADGGTSDDFGGGAYIVSANEESEELLTLGPRFQDCIFQDNYAVTGGGAIYGGNVYNGMRLNIRHCTIKNNKTDGSGGGINSAGAILRHCTIENNYSADRETSQIQMTGDCTLVECTITNPAPRSRSFVTSLTSFMQSVTNPNRATTIE